MGKNTQLNASLPKLSKDWWLQFKLATQQIDCIEDLIAKSKKQHIAYRKVRFYSDSMTILERINRALILLNNAIQH